MNTLFEQELRDLFGDGTIVHKPIFIGRTCFGTLGGDLRVRIEFDDPAVLRNYDSLSVKVINRLSGLVDHIDLPIVDLIGRKMIPDNPNFPDGVAPHIWIYNGTVEGYGNKPSHPWSRSKSIHRRPRENSGTVFPDKSLHIKTTRGVTK